MSDEFDGLVERVQRCLDNPRLRPSQIDARSLLAAIQTLTTRLAESEARERDAVQLARRLRKRMISACDNTRAGKDHVKVKTADWHALMRLGLEDARALNPENTHG